MKYITGYHSLNQRCTTGTSGDWHPASVNWDEPHILDSKDSPLGEEGIVWVKKRYKGDLLEETWIATHARAFADLFYRGLTVDNRHLGSIDCGVEDWIDVPEQVEVLKDMIRTLYKHNPELFNTDKVRRFMVKNFGRDLLEELEGKEKI